MKSTESFFRQYLKSPEWVVFSLVLFFGLISAVLVPQMSVNDENAHFLKSYSVASGKLSGRTCTFPRDILEKAETVSRDSFTNDYSSPVNYDDSSETTCGSAAGYSLIMHLPQSAGIFVGKLFNTSPSVMVLLGRLTSAVFYAICIFWIVRFAKVGKWAFAVIGLFPTMIHTAGSLSGDTVNNLVVLLFFVTLFNLFIQQKYISRKQLTFLVITIILLSLTKSSNIIFIMLLLVLPEQRFKALDKPKLSGRQLKWLVVVSCGFIALIATYLSYIFFGSLLFRDIPTVNPLYENPSKIISILYNTYLNTSIGYGDLLLRGVVGEFSSFRYHLPPFFVLAQYFLLLIALLYRDRRPLSISSKDLSKLAFVCFLALVLFILAVTVALYSGWAILPKRLGQNALYADGVQGRYFTTALALLVPIGVWARKYIWVNLRPDYCMGLIVFCVTISSLLFYTLQTYVTYY